MLIYHQHHDTYHSIFRMLSVLYMLGGKEIEFSKLRIIDFYFLFPSLVADIQFPRLTGVTKIKKASMAFPVPYEMLPDKKRLFSELGDFQIQAAHILRAKRIIRENEYSVISIDAHFSNEVIVTLLTGSRYSKDSFFVDLVKIFMEIPLIGKDGLKRRTGLMEYRYDAI